jgi:hypothetical protein
MLFASIPTGPSVGTQLGDRFFMISMFLKTLLAGHMRSDKASATPVTREVVIFVISFVF